MIVLKIQGNGGTMKSIMCPFNLRPALEILSTSNSTQKDRKSIPKVIRLITNIQRNHL